MGIPIRANTQINDAQKMERKKGTAVYLFETATLSNSSLFLKAYEFGDSLAALMSSSAKHSAMVFMLRKDASRAPLISYEFTFELLSKVTSLLLKQVFQINLKLMNKTYSRKLCTLFIPMPIYFKKFHFILFIFTRITNTKVTKINSFLLKLIF